MSKPKKPEVLLPTVTVVYHAPCLLPKPESDSHAGPMAHVLPLDPADGSRIALRRLGNILDMERFDEELRTARDQLMEESPGEEVSTVDVWWRVQHNRVSS
jgi:hypothetical protein